MPTKRSRADRPHHDVPAAPSASPKGASKAKTTTRPPSSRVRTARANALALPKNDYVRARIETSIKHEAEAVLAAIGLTVSDAMRLMLVRIVEERKLPFDPRVPNEKTIAAIAASRQGRVTAVASAADLLADLDG